MKVALRSIPPYENGVPSLVLGKSHMKRLVNVTHEVGQEHQALRQVICSQKKPSNDQSFSIYLIHPSIYLSLNIPYIHWMISHKSGAVQCSC